MSTLVGHFVLSPREREKRDRTDSRGDEREGQGREGQGIERQERTRKMNEKILVSKQMSVTSCFHNK